MTDAYPIRQPLGLPKGSIRGFIALQITIMFWLFLLLPDTYSITINLNWYFLLALVLMFFVSHQPASANPGDTVHVPYHIPLFRLLILFGTVAVIVFMYLNYPDRLTARLTPNPEEMRANWHKFLLSLVAGFAVGYMMKILPGKDSWIFQTLQAWLSIIAMMLLVVELVIQIFINPNITQQFDLVAWQCALTAIIACYFGWRA